MRGVVGWLRVIHRLGPERVLELAGRGVAFRGAHPGHVLTRDVQHPPASGWDLSRESTSSTTALSATSNSA